MIRNRKGFTLVEIMIVVAIIGILIAIAVPGFLRAREKSRQNACQENLTKIDGGKQQWALEQRKNPSDTPTATDLYGETLYVRFTPVCPTGGTYTINNVDTQPTCSNSTLAQFPHTYPTGS